jgi:hypothetical protein
MMEILEVIASVLVCVIAFVVAYVTVMAVKEMFAK